MSTAIVVPELPADQAPTGDEAASRPRLSLVNAPAGLQGSVLVVCRGNICRSPVAEALLAHALQGTGVSVSSAGLSARTGETISEPMAELLPRALRASTADFAARSVDESLISSSDLILTATRSQRGELVVRQPSALRKTFTLREFASLAELLRQDLDGAGGQLPTRLSELVASVPTARGRRPLRDNEFDVPDPYGRSVRANRRSYAMIEESVAIIATALRP